MTQKKYTKGNITVIWQPALCQHSALCWKGLIQVFNPKKRPWINMEGDSAERIIGQVKKCPSGALSYVNNSETKLPDIN
jgi:uncharacterized Fe-S cluster protein YjdI